MKTCIISFIILFTFHVVSINAQFLKGDGNVVKSERKVSSFNYIEVEDGIDLYVTQGNDNELVIEADQNLVQYFVIKKEEDVLKIQLSKSIYKAKSLKYM